MDGRLWLRGKGLIPNKGRQESSLGALKREPGRQRRTGPKRLRLRLLNATGLCGAGKARRKTAGSSTHTPRKMNARQRRIHKRRLASEAAMKKRLAAKAAA